MAQGSRIASKAEAAREGRKAKKQRRPWTRPVLEDVSGRVMAQPYIRFT